MTLTELERKLKTANRKVYELECERTILLRRIEELLAENTALKTPKQLKEKKERSNNTLKPSEPDPYLEGLLNRESNVIPR